MKWLSPSMTRKETGCLVLEPALGALALVTHVIQQRPCVDEVALQPQRPGERLLGIGQRSALEQHHAFQVVDEGVAPVELRCRLERDQSCLEIAGP